MTAITPMPTIHHISLTRKATAAVVVVALEPIAALDAESAEVLQTIRGLL